MSDDNCFYCGLSPSEWNKPNWCLLEGKCGKVDALAARLAEADWLLNNLPLRDDDADEQDEWGERLRKYFRAADSASVPATIRPGPDLSDEPL